MKIYGYVEKGMGKTECQDRVLIGDTILAGGFLSADYEGDGNLLVAVADGVGGNPGGERASLLAVDSIRVLNRRTNLVEEDVKQLLSYTNGQILRAGQLTPGMKQMATTLTAFVMNQEKALSIHIGNCRLCTYKKYLKALTKDQTEVADMVSRGELTREEALVSPIRNQINACLGGGREEYFQALQIETQDSVSAQESNLLLTCDGIHDYVGEEELEMLLLSAGEAQTVCRSMAETARKNGSLDDISIILVDRMGRYQ